MRRAGTCAHNYSAPLITCACVCVCVRVRVCGEKRILCSGEIFFVEDLTGKSAAL